MVNRTFRRVFAFAGVVGMASACNAIVGNGDIVIGDDASTGDATTLTGRDGSLIQDGFDGTFDQNSHPGADTGGGDADLGPLVDGGPGSCEGGAKVCNGRCVALDDPAFGCGVQACDPCELPGAVSGCALPKIAADAGRDAGPPVLTCSVAVCKAGRGDCNRNAADGCEIDTSGDLYNCGACGHDCSRLPHVQGNVSCVAGTCTFDGTACAPGYGICSTNPDVGCDTAISQPGNCGGCGTACGAGTPYCSPTGRAAPAFACTSGCGTGLSLCGGSCVDEMTDPDHCGACGTVCPAVTGGTAVCATGGSCSFICNASDHLCGSGGGTSCAANNDGTHCGTGASCGKCAAPTNATPTCSGGTTCGYSCTPGSHACGAACPLNGDPDNCGTSCNTNCPGPTEGTGAPTCAGNLCALACTPGQTACGTACVNEQADAKNCGGCSNTCGVGQACSGGQCVCNAATCPGGCCDGSGVCQAAPACVTAANACAAGCPATVPQSASLLLWLVGDTYAASQSTWADQSGHNADATCTTCPSALGATLNGHAAVPFDGNSFFTLTDPGGAYTAAAFTVFVVAFPESDAAANAQVITLSTANAGASFALGRSTGPDDLAVSVTSGGATSALVASGGWSNAWELIVASADGASHGFLSAGGSTTTGTLPAPAVVDYPSSFLGTDMTNSQTFTGKIAEVIVFRTSLSPASSSAIQSYLAAKYAL